jgi:hypothetical protein
MNFRYDWYRIVYYFCAGQRPGVASDIHGERPRHSGGARDIQAGASDIL